MSVDEQDEQQEQQPGPVEPPVEPQDGAATTGQVEQEQAAPAPNASADAPTQAQAPAGRSDDRRPRGESRERGRPRFGRRRRPCAFCLEKARVIDYKDPGKLRRYVSDRGRIEPRRKTGTCTKHQRWLSVALKRARLLALLPYTTEHIRVSGTFTTRGR
ncbi:MAG: 30S ribosomal protein S18 [Chloroflexi bacterium]|nr:30S ribosomal protein S18 [Chloroflexota bacterium]